ncbi:hypothetical protein EDB80DRAFT_875017 [Ilyonectria destructans]|nr:hypothetical protein EDB80DRAFT_875017 [Ilyonectria destructans]
MWYDSPQGALLPTSKHSLLIKFPIDGLEWKHRSLTDEEYAQLKDRLKVGKQDISESTKFVAVVRLTPEWLHEYQRSVSRAVDKAGSTLKDSNPPAPDDSTTPEHEVPPANNTDNRKPAQRAHQHWNAATLLRDSSLLDAVSHAALRGCISLALTRPRRSDTSLVVASDTYFEELGDCSEHHLVHQFGRAGRNLDGEIADTVLICRRPKHPVYAFTQHSLTAGPRPPLRRRRTGIGLHDE